MLRRVAFVGACHLLLHHTASFCCAAAAWVCYNPAAQQQFSPAAAGACNSMCVAAVVVADCFDRSVLCVTPPYTHISAVLPLRAHVHSVSIDRANLGGNIGAFLIAIYIPTHPYVQVHRGSIFTYMPGVMLCVGDFAHTTDDRHQTT